MYCETGTDGYFEAGKGAKLLKIPCCEKCYRNLIVPLSQDQINIMAEAANILVWQDIDCDFEVK
jgi:hypothetical protein